MAAVSSSVLSSANWLWRQAKPPWLECHGQAQILSFGRAKSAVFRGCRSLLKSGAERVSCPRDDHVLERGLERPGLDQHVHRATGHDQMLHGVAADEDERCASTDAVSTMPSLRSRPRNRPGPPRPVSTKVLNA